MSEASTVEAVVISGPRRGEIVHVDLDSQEVITEEQAQLLAGALRELDAALVKLLDRTKSLDRTLAKATEHWERGDWP